MGSTSTPFSEKLTATLAHRGLSQSQVADAMNLTRASVSDWCRGQAVPAPETVFALEVVLGVPPGELSRELGYLPIIPTAEAPVTTLGCIARDPLLDDTDREILTLVYEKLAGARRAQRRRS